MRFETIQSRTKFVGRAFSVRQDDVRLPNGNTTCLDIIEHSGAVTILPVDSDGMIWFVRQYRHAAGTEILELPAGGLEDGETPEICAQREIQEEIGMGAKKLQEIGGFFLAPGYSSEFLHIYLATDLYSSVLPKDVDEILIVEKIPASRALELARNGQIQDAKTLASFYLALPFLESSLL
jgi:ADP-ribose pyrophosphatase